VHGFGVLDTVLDYLRLEHSDAHHVHPGIGCGEHNHIQQVLQ